MRCVSCAWGNSAWHLVCFTRGMRSEKTTALAPVAWHLVARASFPSKPYESRRECLRVWAALARAFPNCVAAVVMPNHLHLIVWSSEHESPRGLRIKLRRVIDGSLGVSWEPIPTPSRIPDLHHLLRQIRYVHLNPCRKGLCADPIAWEWSTHLDYLGFIARPWPKTPSILKMLRMSPSKFHRYVSSDPSVATEGSPPPFPLPEDTKFDLALAARAARLCLRCPSRRLERKGKLRALLTRSLTETCEAPRIEIARRFGIYHTSVSGITPKDLSTVRALKLALWDPRTRELIVKPNGSDHVERNPQY